MQCVLGWAASRSRPRPVRQMRAATSHRIPAAHNTPKHASQPFTCTRAGRAPHRELCPEGMRPQRQRLLVRLQHKGGAAAAAAGRQLPLAVAGKAVLGLRCTEDREGVQGRRGTHPAGGTPPQPTMPGLKAAMRSSTAAAGPGVQHALPQACAAARPLPQRATLVPTWRGPRLPNWGKQTGTPPRMALGGWNTALGDTKMSCSPPTDHPVSVAPCLPAGGQGVRGGLCCLATAGRAGPRQLQLLGEAALPGLPSSSRRHPTGRDRPKPQVSFDGND